MQLTDATTRSQQSAFAFPVDTVEGTLPSELEGVLFRNGGGLFEVGDDTLAFLDGYGLIAGLEIADGQAYFRSAYPETDVFVGERRAGRMLRRRIFTNLPGWRRNVFNVMPSTSGAHDSYVWNGQVHAADLGQHTSLSLPELKTLGTDPLPVQGRELAAPMPRDDPHSGRLVSYVLKQSPAGDRLTLLEVDESFREVRRTEPVKLQGLVHDVAFTDDWYVLIENAVKPNPLRALMGRVPLWQSFEWSGAPPTLLLVPRGRAGGPVRLPMEGTALQTVFHIVNAYQDGPHVVADVIGYEGPVSFDAIMRPSADAATPMPENRVVRLRGNPRAGVTAVVEDHGAQGEAPEVAPAVHGRRHTAAWFAALPGRLARDPFVYLFTSAMARLDVETHEVTTWDAGPGHQLSPPAFAPDPTRGAEQGWVLAWDLDLAAETTDVVVLDADDLPAGPVARIRLGVYLPAVSHVRFEPGVRISA